MPSQATITTFFEFAPNTKARASQANTNFSNFRGHLLSIEPLTATSSNNTYDLGADTHRWRVGYVRDIDFYSSTTTAGVVLKGDTAITGGAFRFEIGGTLCGMIAFDGIRGQYLKLLSVDTASLANAAVTTIKIADANVTAAKIESNVQLTGTTAAVGSRHIVVGNVNLGTQFSMLPTTHPTWTGAGHSATGNGIGFTEDGNLGTGVAVFTTAFSARPILIVTPTRDNVTVTVSAITTTGFSYATTGPAGQQMGEFDILAIGPR